MLTQIGAFIKKNKIIKPKFLRKLFLYLIDYVCFAEFLTLYSQ